jgi:hypothetical protein
VPTLLAPPVEVVVEHGDQRTDITGNRRVTSSLDISSFDSSHAPTVPSDDAVHAVDGP